MPVGDDDPPFRGVGCVLFRKVASNLELRTATPNQDICNPEVYFAAVVRAPFRRLEVVQSYGEAKRANSCGSLQVSIS